MKRSEFLASLIGFIGAGAPAVFAAQASLYVRLGEEPPLRQVVEALYARLTTDPRTRDRFVDVDMPRLKNQVFTFLAQAAGGPQKYMGKDIRFVHTKLKITEVEWQATVEALTQALTQFKVPAREKDDTLALVGSLKADIVHG